MCLVSLLASACGGSSGADPGSSTAPSTPAPIVTAAGPVPEVEGGFGETPKVTIPSETPADALVSKTLVTGTGPVVKAGDLLVVNYLGETWDDGNVFDSSFDRGQPTSFPIGVGKVIPGWDAALVGQTVGSRVVMAIPPSLGYGEAGQPDAKISGDDTLVFVVDILGAYAPDAIGTSTPTDADLSGLPTVTGLPGTKPTLTVPAGTKPPKEVTTVVLAEGDGPKVTAGSFVVVQYEAVTWNGNALGSTWSAGQPQGVPVGLAAAPTPFDELVGLRVGSRVLLLVPAEPSGDAAVDSTAVVVDIVDSLPPTS
ncbi:MAG TPA: FKBP-type peptidyl-prolyl cis-trans isomerase [Candidatus Limnocylindria bacterium]|nr:FKBP-type peptidyl-prolyl cis-trans isomerase [Candidatus Limnocylindria bacterium]